MDLKAAVINKIKTLGKKEIALILLIFLLGFGVRAHLMKYELMFEFDSYYHARLLGYMVKEVLPLPSNIPEIDPLAYYQRPEGGLPISKTGMLFWVISGLIYKILTLGAGYDKGLVIAFAKFLPAFYGALISVTMYFLGKEIYSRKAGLVMGIFAAVVPAFVYRTMAGFFEEDSFGFLFMILGFVLLVKSLKQNSFGRTAAIYAVGGGAMFGLMALSWEMFRIVPIILLGYFIIVMATAWLKQVEMKRVVATALSVAVTFLIFAIIATPAAPTWIGTVAESLATYLPYRLENIEKIQNPGGAGFTLSVGEESPGRFYFGHKYNALVIFPFVAIGLVIYRLFFRKFDNLSPLLLSWILVALGMAWIKLKFTYVFGLPIAASAGLVFEDYLNYLAKRNNVERILLAVPLAILLLIGISAGAYFVTTNHPQIATEVGWKEALEWARQNTPKDAKFMNWWDEGHWITFLAERKVVEDNRNADLVADSASALLFVTTDEEEAYETAKQYDADFVIFGYDLLGKLSALNAYAYSEHGKKGGTGIDVLAVTAACRQETDPLTNQTGFNCQQNLFTPSQFIQIPSTYTAKANTLLNSRIPAIIYKEANNSRIYVFNESSNQAIIVRLWFNDPSLKHFQLVYSNSQVKIFRINE